ncbi:HEAT repeat domain-containing protein [Streptomyces sp. DH10]|uniref:HEAT repeat domain-containing protein n=1 Tax=Streptomyces sp. DH10 TaxID=3040121 RepID=UPI002441FD72|nr:HEAT repeat domain-containing protein [Streptomyces sp. DH10]MDG9711346.1 HEAT repeat domain-containing protein [Streptomyces sp. DH10]
MVTEPDNLTWRERRAARRWLRTLRQHRDGATRQRACWQLGQTGVPGAAEALADAAAHDQSDYVRTSALMALARLDARPFADVFSHALNDWSNMVVEAAIKGLIAVGDPSHAEDVAVHLDHELHGVRRAASAALHEWGWATDDVRRARVAIAREAWSEVAALDAGAVAEVARLLANDRYWFTYNWDEERQMGIRALEQLMERHAVQLSDADLLVVEELASLEAPAVRGRDEYGRPLYYREFDLTGLRRLCSVELKRRAPDE